ncbi:MAG: hypothetical protein DLM72_18145 [Candidatus Nitrosopolaris wilkensis]|nr:MAG: hypothetical protein DLM72_18145 [Candidatus Nitrosopolaris wilkensis]
MSSEKDPQSLTTNSRFHDFNEYKDRTYEELSQEFQEVYSAAARAFGLIPLMYNRLTLVEGMIHKQAVEKIYNDHHHLSGFTHRNIRRYLPADNPNIPRRIRTSRPNNSVIESAEYSELGTNVQESYATGIDFEFSFSFDEVRRYMESIWRENTDVGKVHFHGTIDTRTGKVTSVFTGNSSCNLTNKRGGGFENHVKIHFHINMSINS